MILTTRLIIIRIILGTAITAARTTTVIELAICFPFFG